MTAETPPRSASPEGFRDRFETLIPSIQGEWPAVARQPLEARSLPALVATSAGQVMVLAGTSGK